MTTESSKFHFSSEVTEFSKTLGRLTPDGFAPAVGDTVEIAKYFLGVRIESGIIVKNYWYGNLMVHFRKVYDYVDSDLQDYDCIDKDVTGCIVSFKQPVSKAFAKSKFDNVVGAKITAGRIKAMLSRAEDGSFLLTGRLKCFVGARAVISTKKIDNFNRKHSNQTIVENVAWSGNILTRRLLAKFNEELDEFCYREPADYHPGSGTVVRDIVHPSLYCYVKGASELKAPPDLAFSQSLANREGGEDVWGRKYEQSIYQWLPSEFHVSENGKVRINSYINNLDQEKYPGIYDGLERMFERILPMFEAVCGSLRNDFYGASCDNVPEHLSLRNRTLQVIPKIVEYRVNGKTNFDGVWHVEGMSHENILATGLCIVKRDKNFAGAEIEFRRFLFEEEGNDLIESTPQNAHSPIDEMAGGNVRPLGRMKTPGKRVIVFPNSHIHRLSSMYSSDGNEAVRRIVVFWLVNPERPIISTAQVAPQQGVMTRNDAERYRLALMAERKLHKEDYSAREVSLCEH